MIEVTNRKSHSIHILEPHFIATKHEYDFATERQRKLNSRRPRHFNGRRLVADAKIASTDEVQLIARSNNFEYFLLEVEELTIVQPRRVKGRRTGRKAPKRWTREACLRSLALAA